VLRRLAPARVFDKQIRKFNRLAGDEVYARPGTIESALLLVVLVRGVGVAQVADGARGQVREGESIGPVDA
jgi:hypothetical protein